VHPGKTAPISKNRYSSLSMVTMEKIYQREVLRMAWWSNLVAQFFNKMYTPQQVGNFLIVKSRVKNSVK
jgi:hypothetical protein